MAPLRAASRTRRPPGCIECSAVAIAGAVCCGAGVRARDAADPLTTPPRTAGLPCHLRAAPSVGVGADCGDATATPSCSYIWDLGARCAVLLPWPSAPRCRPSSAAPFSRPCCWLLCGALLASLPTHHHACCDQACTIDGLTRLAGHLVWATCQRGAPYWSSSVCLPFYVVWGARCCSTQRAAGCVCVGVYVCVEGTSHHQRLFESQSVAMTVSRGLVVCVYMCVCVCGSTRRLRRACWRLFCASPSTKIWRFSTRVV